MKSALRQYYLQALGIDRWVRRPLGRVARGNSTALMIIGDSDDQHGLSFVGKAGVLLNKMLGSIGLTPQDVVLAQGFKHRLPTNREPVSEEIQQGNELIQQQIQQVNPRLILALGELAGQFVLGKPLSLTNMRQTAHQYNNTPVVVSYHPVDLLRNPLDKQYAWQDLVWVTALLQANTVD